MIWYYYATRLNLKKTNKRRVQILLSKKKIKMSIAILKTEAV